MLNNDQVHAELERIGLGKFWDNTMWVEGKSDYDLWKIQRDILRLLAERLAPKPFSDEEMSRMTLGEYMKHFELENALLKIALAESQQALGEIAEEQPSIWASSKPNPVVMTCPKCEQLIEIARNAVKGGSNATIG